jgi:hypothetical protein
MPDRAAETHFERAPKLIIWPFGEPSFSADAAAARSRVP